MGHYQHLTTEQRENIMVLVGQGLSIRATARIVGCSASTLSRELRRNCKADGTYSASYAAKAYKKRRKRCRKPHIMSNPEAAAYVIERLQRRWTPEQIAGRARLEKFPVSFSFATIYRAIDQRILPYALKKLMRFKCKYKKHKSNDKRGVMQDILSIHERPASVETRKRIGHWESDTVLGQRKTGAIGTHVERKTGFLIAFKLDSGTSEEFTARTISCFATLPPKVRKSFTVDRGKEFTLHEHLSEALEMPVYFCDPYCPWQRATNENTNGLLRQFYPKKTSFASISDEDLAHTASLINNRPRKRLGWRSPAELFPHF